MDAIKFGFKYWKKYIVAAVILQIVSFLAIIADLLIPFVSELFVDFVIMDNDSEASGVFAFLIDGDYGKRHSFELFFNIAFVFLALLVFRLIFIYIKNTMLEKYALKFETDLRVVTFDKLMQLDSQTVSEYNTGELLTTLHTDTIMMKDLFGRIIPGMFDSMFVLGACTMLLTSINVTLLIIPVLLAPFFVVALLKFRKKAQKNYRDIRSSNSNMNLTVQENIEAVRLVRSFTNEGREKEKFDKSNMNMKNSYINQVKLSAGFEVIFSSIKQAAYIGTIALCAILVIKGQMLVGFLVAASGYVMKIMDHVSQINNMLFQMQQQIVAGDKIRSFMACETKIKDGTYSAKNIDKPDIEFKNVEFEYSKGETVLKNVSFTAKQGEVTALVGPSGGGKTTISKLCARFWDATKGKILLGGVDISKIDPETLLNNYSIVFQDVTLFDNTVMENIRIGKKGATDDEVIKAAKQAKCDEFIKNLPEGYNTYIGENGCNLSGGERQRISIARAILKNSPIILLDEATASLDAENETEIQEAISKLVKNKTVLIIAHRMRTVTNADKIVLLKDGVVKEQGSPKELLGKNSIFKDMVNKQQESMEWKLN